jgi:hypothetical protein
MLFKEVSAVSSEKRKKIINKKGKLLIVEASGTYAFTTTKCSKWKFRSAGKLLQKWKKVK